MIGQRFWFLAKRPNGPEAAPNMKYKCANSLGGRWDFGRLVRWEELTNFAKRSRVLWHINIAVADKGHKNVPLCVCGWDW